MTGTDVPPIGVMQDPVRPRRSPDEDTSVWSAPQAPHPDLPWDPGDLRSFDDSNYLGTPRVSAMGPSGFRVAQRMGADRYQQAWTVRGMLDLGVSRDKLPEAARGLIDEFDQLTLDDSLRGFAAATYAQQHTIDNPLELGIRGAGEFADRLLSAAPQFIYGIGSLFSKKVPQTMNDAIGLDGVQSPRVGFYLAAADLRSKAAAEGKTMSLSEAYDIVQRGEEIRTGALGKAGQIFTSSSGALGDLAALIAGGPAAEAGRIGKVAGLTGSWSTTPLSFMAGAAERGIGLTAAAERLGAAAVGKGAAARLGLLATKEALLPGARFGLWAGLADYANPDGTVKDGWQRLSQGLVSAATMPLFAGVSAMAGRAATALTGESRVLRGAFQRWLGDNGAKLGSNLDEAWAIYAQQGYPGAPKDYVRRFAGGAIQSALEGVGFSATDLGFWHGAIDAIGGDAKAKERAIDTMLGNGLMMATLRFGGGRNALSVREMERVHDWLTDRAYTRIPEGQPIPGAEPAAKPEAAPAPTEPEAPKGKPYDLDAEVEAAEAWLDTQSDPRAERDLMLNRAVAAARDATDPAVRDAYLRYAGKVYRWKDSLIDGPDAAEPAVREQVSAWQKDIDARRSRVANRAQEQAKNVAEGRQPEEAAPPRPKQVTPFDLRTIAKGMGGRVSESRGKVAADRAKPEPPPEKPVRPLEEKPEVQGPDLSFDLEARRDAEIADARVALEGIGGPSAEEGVKLVYDKKAPPRLVTYQDGKYWQRKVYGDRTWKPMTDREIGKLRGKDQPADAITEQLAVVDQVAKRIFELGDQLSPDEQRAVIGAARISATVDRAKDPGVNAALTMAEQVLPQSWSKDQLTAWAQMALRGYTPEAQQAIAAEFAADAKLQGSGEDLPGLTPGLTAKRPDHLPGVPSSESDLTPTEKAKQGVPEKGRQATPWNANRPQRTPSAPAASPSPQSQPAASRERTATKESALSQADEETIRGVAEDFGFPTQGRSRQDIEADLRSVGFDTIETMAGPPGSESGAVDVKTAAVAAAVAGATLIPGVGGVVTPSTVGGAIVLSMVPKLHAFWAKKNSEALEDINREKAPPLVEAFQRQRDRSAELLRRVAGKVQELRDMTGENIWTKAGRSHAKATRDLQHVTWDSEGKTTAGDDLVNLYLDGHAPIPKDLDPKQREILDRMIALRNEVGDMVAELGVWRRNSKTGAYYRAKFSHDVMRLPRVYTYEGNDILSAIGSEGWNAIRDGIQDRAAREGIKLTRPEVEQQLRQVSEMEPYRRGNFEVERMIRWMPSYVRVNGHPVQVLETRPYEWSKRYADLSAKRLAHIETWGEESLGKPGEEQKGLTEQVGLKTSLVNPTPEQTANRTALEDFIATSKNQRRATEVVLAVMRAHHGLAIDKPLRIPFVMDTQPGTLSHSLLRAMHPVTSAWRAVKLTTAAVQNLPEPWAVAQTMLGLERITRNQLAAWAMQLTQPDKFRTEVARLARDIGGAATETSTRMGGLSTSESRPGHRFSDIAHLVELAAAPMEIVNRVNDVALGWAGEEATALWKKGDMSEGQRIFWDQTLRYLRFNQADRTKYLSGKATPEMERAFVRRLRVDIYHVRDRQDQGLIQQMRLTKGVLPFQGWTAGNMRAWGRMVGTVAEVWKDPNSTWRERMAAAQRFTRFTVSKLGVHAASYMGITAAFAGSALRQAFQGNDDEQTTKNFVEKLGWFALGQEIAGPIVGSFMSVLAGKAHSEGSLPAQVVDATIKTIPLVDFGANVWNALNRTGQYEDARPGVAGWWDVAVDFARQEIPAMRAIDNVAHDPGMAMAIRRYYEVFPSKSGGGSTENEHDDLRGSMSRLIQKILRSGRDLRNLEPDALIADLRAALESPPTDEIKKQQWEHASPDERMEMGKKHVLDSLRSRDLWGTMGQERQDVYVQKAGKENARALAAYSEMLSVIADLVKRTF